MGRKTLIVEPNRWYLLNELNGVASPTTLMTMQNNVEGVVYVTGGVISTLPSNNPTRNDQADGEFVYWENKGEVAINLTDWFPDLVNPQYVFVWPTEKGRITGRWL